MLLLCWLILPGLWAPRANPHLIWEVWRSKRPKIVRIRWGFSRDCPGRFSGGCPEGPRGQPEPEGARGGFPGLPREARKVPGEGPRGCRGRPRRGKVVKPARADNRAGGAGVVPPGSVAKRAPLIPLGLPLVAKLCIEVCDRAMKKAIEKDSCNRIVEESQEKRAIE